MSFQRTTTIACCWILFFFVFALRSVVDCNDSENQRMALCALSNSLYSEPSFNWDCETAFNVCLSITWQGIECNDEHFVVSIDLFNESLPGSLPTQIGLLTYLISLNLSMNRLYGNLPKQLSNLNQLSILDLSQNYFEGTLPTLLSSLSYLHALNLSHNTLTGTIPLQFGNVTSNKFWSNLTDLDLSSNSFSGTIPKTIEDLSNLKSLFLGDNPQLKGSIPYTFGIKLKLEKIDFSEPLQLCSEIPFSWKQNQWKYCDLTGVIYDSCLDSVSHCKNNPNCGLISCDEKKKDIILITTAACCAVAGVISVIIAVILCRRRKYDKVKHVEDMKKAFSDFINDELSFFFDPSTALQRGYIAVENNHPLFYKKMINSRIKELSTSSEDSLESKLFTTLVQTLDWGGIVTSSVFALIAPLQVQTFCAHHKMQISKIKNTPDLFYSKNWKQHEDPTGIRKWTHDQYKNKISCYYWNTGSIEDGPIIPVVHATSLEVAGKIVANGFHALSTLDAGYYGKGIYCTTSAMYSTPYFATKSVPAILICLSLPGNAYPVTENPSNGLLLGKPVLSGYQSHYVKTSKNGKPFEEIPTVSSYDEFVFDSPAQLLPMFLVEVNKSCLLKIIQIYEREVLEPPQDTDNENNYTKPFLNHEEDQLTELFHQPKGSLPSISTLPSISSLRSSDGSYHPL